MLLAEELMLLCLDDEGGWPLLQEEPLNQSMAMALVFETSLRGLTRLGESGRLERTDVADSGDPVLDLATARVGGATPTDAVQGLADEDLSGAILTLLVQRGIVHADDQTPGHYPQRRAEVEIGVRERLRTVLAYGAEPSVHDVALIALLDHVALTSAVLPGEDVGRVSERARQISSNWREMDAFRRAAPAPRLTTDDGSAEDGQTDDRERGARSLRDRMSGGIDVLDLISFPFRLFDGL